VAVKLTHNGFGTGAVFTLRFQKPFNKDNDFILKLFLKASVLSSAVGGQFVRAMPGAGAKEKLSPRPVLVPSCSHNVTSRLGVRRNFGYYFCLFFIIFVV
jgi:hypothetical protein